VGELPGEVELQKVDRALLAALATSSSLVEASRRAGIGRDRAVYRIRRLERSLRREIVRAHRGGPGHGRTELTPYGRSLLRGVVPRSRRLNRFEGTYLGGPAPRVRLRGGTELAVAFRAKPGEHLAVTISPEALLLARHRFPSSARNVLTGRVAGRLPRGKGPPVLPLDCGGLRLRAAVTPQSVRSLGLVPGRRVFVYLKATAVRPERGIAGLAD
jgi:molybdopterin-binding protein/molybdate transport repressor ModE-like protein